MESLPTEVILQIAQCLTKIGDKYKLWSLCHKIMWAIDQYYRDYCMSIRPKRLQNQPITIEEDLAIRICHDGLNIDECKRLVPFASNPPVWTIFHDLNRRDIIYDSIFIQCSSSMRCHKNQALIKYGHLLKDTSITQIKTYIASQTGMINILEDLISRSAWFNFTIYHYICDILSDNLITFFNQDQYRCACDVAITYGHVQCARRLIELGCPVISHRSRLFYDQIKNELNKSS